MDFKFMVFWMAIVIILLIPEPVKTMVIYLIILGSVFNFLQNRIQFILK